MSGGTQWEKTVDIQRGVIHERSWKEASFDAMAWPHGDGPLVLNVFCADGSVLRMLLPESLVPEGAEGRRGRWRFTVEFEPEEER